LRIFKHFVPAQILVLGAVDAVVLYASMYAGIALRFFGEGLGAQEELLPIYPKALAFSAMMLVTHSAMGLYTRDIVRGNWDYSVRFFASFVLGTALMTLVFYALPELFLGRGAFALTVASAIVFSILARAVFLRIVDRDGLRRRILVLGTGTRAAGVEEMIRRHNLSHRIELVGYLPMGSTSHHVDESKIIKDQAPLLAIVTRYGVEELVVGIRDRRNGGTLIKELLECKLEGISIVELSSFFERETGHVQLDSLNPSWMVFSDGFCRSSYRNTSKRIVDVVVGVTLLVASAPLMLLTAALIYAETGRPIFYRQLRIGECGHPFEVLKFRSMRVDAERDGTPQWAQRNDTRVTQVGRVIRKLRIDELPQIFNVLNGDMSLVGPRPERPHFVAELAREIPHYANRHTVKPGVTGWAQIRYPYGASVEDARQKLQYDLYYAKNHTLFLDMLILLQTAEVVLFGRGAR
jgi:sugar transferase (PEP-CTERM system associated)